MRALGTVVRGAQEVLNALGHVWFPPHCLLSGRYLGMEPQLVRGIADAELLHHPPAPSSTDLAVLLLRHFGRDELALSSVHALWAVGTGTTIDNAVYALKYKGRMRLAGDLGAWLTRHPELETLSSEALIVGVPIHAARHRERGYNQADLIAEGWANDAGRPLLPTGSIVRNRYTPTQTSQNEKERLRNVDGAFIVPDPAVVRGQHVVLVDDVLTTGATLNACAMALLEAGARRVDAATLCAAV
ncbi:MAG: ComF family protein [Candidatus Kapabacteria bacterium]|nr:ComF family protein [Candidatus Kapabacteria bacterium]